MKLPFHAAVFLPATLLALAPAAPAQQQTATAETGAVTETLLVPLHRTPAAATGGAEEIWSAGPDWKASFHDGFAFYPVLGATFPRDLPFRWRTESVTVGERTFVADRTETAIRFTDRRLEYRHPGVVEAYDVRPEGVEQTFTLHARPAVVGDLVVTGRIDTELCADSVDGVHRSLTFCSDGRPIVEYGRAWAFDAAGRRTTVTSSFDGERIRLVLGADFLADATYPVTIDPLTSAVVLGTGNAVSSLAISSQDGTTPKQLICFTRQVNGTNHDAFAVEVDPVTGTQRTLFSEVNPLTSPRNIAACWVGNANRWVVAMQWVGFPVGQRINVYVHDAASAMLNSGSTVLVAPPAGLEFHNPELGGGNLASRALLVFEEFNGSNVSGVLGARIDALTAIARTPFRLQPATAFQRFDAPAVTPVKHSSGEWVMAWRSRNTFTNGSSVRVARIRNDGTTVAAPQVLKSFPSGVALADPKVAGSRGRYLCTFVESRSVRTLKTLRFDWTDGTMPPTVVSERVIASRSTGALVNGTVAYDWQTRSHWALTYRSLDFLSRRRGYAVRVGFTGAVVESQSLHGSTSNGLAYPVVAAGRPNSFGRFYVAYSTTESSPGNPIYRREFQYPADARGQAYGSSCGMFRGFSGLPYAGNEFFQLGQQNLAPGELVILLFNFAGQANVNLGPNGMPGCFLQVQPTGASTFFLFADGMGEASFPLPLPDFPMFQGDFYTQWFRLSPGANPVGLVASQGIKWQVR